MSLLPPELFYLARPRFGWLLVERHEEPYTYGGFIIVPPSYRSRRRPPFATVMAVGDGVDPRWCLEQGSVVAVRTSVSLRIGFGDTSTDWGETDSEGEPRRGVRYLYLCRPEQLLTHVLSDDTHRIEDIGEHRRRYYRESDYERIASEGRAEHGVTK